VRDTPQSQATAHAFAAGAGPADAERGPEREPAGSVRAVLARSARISILLLGLAVAGITVAAWLGGGERQLAVEYDGFD
jgi:hypothetical protein